MAFDLGQCLDNYWFTGQWDVMEQVCRARLDQAPGDIEVAFALAESCCALGRTNEALELLRRFVETAEDARVPGRLSWLLQEAGDLDGAIAAFRQARSLDPTCSLVHPHFDQLLEVRDRIDDALARQYSTRTPAGGLMLVHPAGAGFWSEVHHVLGHALAAQIDGRRMLVQWGEHSLFTDDPSRNAWLDFFEPTQAVDPAEIEAAADRGVFPGAWGGGSPFRGIAARRGATGPISAVDLIARPEPLVVGSHFTGVHLVRHLLPMDHPLAGVDTRATLRALTSTFLRPRAHLAERAATFVADQFGDTPFIATHVRGTDKRSEQGDLLGVVNLAIGNIVDRLLAGRNGIRLLLLTDDRDIERQYRERYGSRVVMSAALRGQGRQSVHLGSGLPQRRLGEEVLVDVLTALAAESFVGNRFSNVACIVRALKDWPKGTLHMLGVDDAAHNYAASVLQ